MFRFIMMHQIYDAIFVNKYRDTYRIPIGMYSFSKESNSLAFDIANLRTSFADLD